jgi:SRSO17 transposase
MEGKAMKKRFEVRKEELLAECEVPAELFARLEARLRNFVIPYAKLLNKQQGQHTHTYISGLLSDLEYKNAESIAYRHDQPREGLQHFVGTAPWDHLPLLQLLASQVDQQVGDCAGVLVFDPSAFPKKGTASVGVARQWCGRLGKVDNCQVGIYLGYVSRTEHVLVDFRLYLPREWTNDRDRCLRVGIPKDQIRYRTRHELALEMLDQSGPKLPHAWVAGDDEMGRSSWFRSQLRQRGQQYLLAVPANTTIRDLQGKVPDSSGTGRQRKRPFEQVQAWTKALPVCAWLRLEVRPGEKGPLVVEIVSRRVLARTDTKTIGPEELLVVIRSLQEDGSWKYDYYLSNADWKTALAELARVAKAEHRIEECLQRGKSEAGLADYEVRTWAGWHHHQTLSLLACWFLVWQTLLGKQLAPAITVPQIRAGLAKLLREACGCYDPERIARESTRRLQRTALAYFYCWKQRNRLAPLRVTLLC